MADPDLHIDFGDCISCDEGYPEKDCPRSLRPCGHHCNHFDISDRCHWCGAEVDIDGEPAVVAADRAVEETR